MNPILRLGFPVVCLCRASEHITPDPLSDEEALYSSGPTILHLFHNLSSDSEPDNSDSEDSDSYGYSVLAVPETIPVPYKLCSRKTTTNSRYLQVKLSPWWLALT
ncbi:hypothetical protein DSO57_1015629 [Entomophthora muscae]|uniref:Uncharacterized protein n=1 Tax=Entomophthora muscae TaxID=34485 RepID=A0ACC2U3S9_9FUNG|nr:hypothetical protein DSO57_1015629 [Entomophthora muscae]